MRILGIVLAVCFIASQCLALEIIIDKEKDALLIQAMCATQGYTDTIPVNPMSHETISNPISREDFVIGKIESYCNSVIGQYQRNEAQKNVIPSKIQIIKTVKGGLIGE